MSREVAQMVRLTCDGCGATVDDPTPMRRAGLDLCEACVAGVVVPGLERAVGS